MDFTVPEEIERLSVPPENRTAGSERDEAKAKAEEAAEEMAGGDPEAAERQMAEARDALNRLAERMPSADDRRADALKELRELRREQDKLTRQPDAEAQKDLADRLADTIIGIFLEGVAANGNGALRRGRVPQAAREAETAQV